MIRFSHRLSWIACAAVMVACSSDPKPPPETPVDRDKDPVIKTDDAPAKKTEASSKKSSPVTVDERIKNMCSLPESRFGFDSTSISGPARKVLDAIAKCFVDGPGKGQSLNLVGHADPRGDHDYNLGLGHGRAGSVRDYLVKAGVGADRMDVTSLGENEATGTDEASWQRDRRVEILLAE